ELACSPLDITEIVLNAVGDAQAASPGHIWRLELPDEPMLVNGESDRLHQVLTNLLSNARTHTPEGTTVTARVERVDESVVIGVIDDGPGIPPELQEVVFERFARGDAMRTHSAAESTGLGLAIVSAVTAAHGGRVRLSSRPGHTEFRVTLPALRHA
ncbi:MAG: ATP-binding protein, partial [Propionibacteriaceae bacterium]|nr:ATP-binding protein [Propionibacteriaceae bacterium]